MTKNQPLGAVAEAILPHDLLVVSGAEVLTGDEPPAWVREALTRAPLVVVRRARIENDLIPVGVRGSHRGERAAAFLPEGRVTKLIHPEYLVANQAWRTTPRAAELPHFTVLNMVASLMDPTGLTWGPVGGTGFELASGYPCLTQASDIDLVFRAPAPFPRDWADDLHAALSKLPIRIDVQVEVPAGAIALAEYASGARQIVLRSEKGPRLVVDPWEEIK